MSAPSLPLAALPAYPSISESLTFQLTGLLVVLCALGSIWIVMEIVGAVFRRIPATTVTATTPPPVQSVPVKAVAGPSAAMPDAVLTAVVAAAVHHTLGAGHRIVSVTPSTDRGDWSREGLRDIFTSHRVR